MIPEDVVAAAGPNDPERLMPVRTVALTGGTHIPKADMSL